MGQAFSDAFNRVSDGGAASLTLPWETPLLRAIFGDDPSEFVNLSARPLCMVGSVPEVPVPCARELQLTCSEHVAVTGSLATRAFLALRDEDVIAKRA